MPACARKRRLAACSATCAAGVALATAPAGALAAPIIDVTVPPLPPAPAPADAPAPTVAPPPVAPTPTARAASCRGAGARAGRASSATMRAAVRCLINGERARHGRNTLGSDGRLARAAGRHAADMARRGYFGHVSPGGSSPLRRVRAAGWRGGVGEAIAWGCGSLGTPRATVRAWMASPPHRAILLMGARAVGIGFHRARGCGGRAYWVADVG